MVKKIAIQKGSNQGYASKVVLVVARQAPVYRTGFGRPLQKGSPCPVLEKSLKWGAPEGLDFGQASKRRCDQSSESA